MTHFRTDKLTLWLNEAIISTRGTLEPQGPSVGFNAMNSIVLKNNQGGKIVSDLVSENSQSTH